MVNLFLYKSKRRKTYEMQEIYISHCLNLDYGNALKNAPGYVDIYEENYEINLNDATKEKLKQWQKILTSGITRHMKRFIWILLLVLPQRMHQVLLNLECYHNE